MKQAQTRKARTRPRVSRRAALRRWCIPPAILREPNEVLEATQVLEEFRDDNLRLGLVLWQTLRDITLWASVEGEERGGLFGSDAANQRLSLLLAAGAEPALEISLTALVSVVGNPLSASEEITSLVCLQVSKWAEAHGALATALAYAQAGALSAPEEPGPAYAVGTLALRWGRYARAETWLRRTVGLARRARDWGAYAQAYVDLGALHARRGSLEAAHRHYVQALRAARRHGLLAVRGAALHGLLLLALERGALEDAERYGRGAMRAYGRGHPRHPELLHDMAYVWVTREQHTRAIPILQKLLPSRVEPVERALTLAILARAAAGAGEKELYQDAWSDAWSLINRRAGEEDRHPRALLELARAAGRLRDWTHMERAAKLALQVAGRRGETGVTSQVEELAAELHRRILAE